jgi:hypothetical protein
MKVKIYSLVDVFYYSFYIEGLTKIYGKGNVCFSKKDFPSFAERSFAAIIESDNKQVKIAIDAFDTQRISLDLLDWCDVYAKVNFNSNYLPNLQNEKVIPIGPSFGVRIWNLPETVWFALSNYIKSKESIHFKKNFIANYWRQFKRLPLKKYNNESKSSDNYIYFISSLWAKEPITNANRSIFISLCKKSKEIEFEGGFAPRSDGKSFGYSYLVTNRIALKEYLKNIKRSMIVFNTPAVDNCFGWKLGEFMALGKAIISTENENTLEHPFEHGKHIHFVANNEKEILAAIEKLRLQPKYRKSLEENSKKYFERNLLPEVVLKRIINNFY